MDLSQLASFLTAAPLSDNGRLYALEGDAAIEQLHVERWWAGTALSQCYRIVIDALSNDAGLSLDAMLGQTVLLRSVQADGNLGRHSGLVSEARLVGGDGSLARYRLTLVPWVWMLGHGRHSRIFQDKTVIDIAAEVFAEYGEHAVWETAPDVSNYLAPLGPRSYTVQYRESDLTFVERLLAEEGLGYCFIEDVDAPAGHKLLIFADSSQLPENPVSATALNGIRFHRAAAVEASDAIQAFGPAREMEPASVNLLSWDYKSMNATHASQPVNDSVTELEVYDTAGAYAFANSREAGHYARIAAQALEAKQARWLGWGTVRGAKVASRFRLSASPWESADRPFPESFLWVELTEAGINNLPPSVSQEVAQRLGQTVPAAVSERLWAQAKDTGYAQYMVALDVGLKFRPALIDDHGLRLNPRPTTPGVQSAIVVGPEGETRPTAAGPLHTDSLGRIKVKFHWMEQGASCWLRCLQRYAGNGHGAQFLPRIGQEVLVNFLDGDIDRPVVIGGLYNGQGEAGVAPTPGATEGAVDANAYTAAGDFQPSAQGNLAGGNSPAWHGQSAADAGHRNAAALSGIKSQAFDGAGFNQLVFDDSNGQGRLAMQTTQYHSQLNLGHLIHQADNYRGSFRGQGFELRTDSYGALRGTKGVLLSSYPLPGSESAGDATAAGALLNQHAMLATSLSGAANTHLTTQLSGAIGSLKAGQSELSNRATPFAAITASASARTRGDDYTSSTANSSVSHSANSAPSGQQSVAHSRDAVTLISARDSLATTAGGSIHLASAETLGLGAGKDINIASGNQQRWHAGQSIGLLAGAEGATGTGLHLAAGKGKVEMEAQHDSMQLQSQKDLQLLTNGKLDLSAAESITLATAGGASIEIKGGNITFKAPGKLMVQAANHQFAAGGSVTAPLAALPSTLSAPKLANLSMKAVLGLPTLAEDDVVAGKREEDKRKVLDMVQKDYGARSERNLSKLVITPWYKSMTEDDRMRMIHIILYMSENHNNVDRNILDNTIDKVVGKQPNYTIAFTDPLPEWADFDGHVVAFSELDKGGLVLNRKIFNKNGSVVVKGYTKKSIVLGILPHEINHLVNDFTVTHDVYYLMGEYRGKYVGYMASHGKWMDNEAAAKVWSNLVENLSKNDEKNPYWDRAKPLMKDPYQRMYLFAYITDITGVQNVNKNNFRNVLKDESLWTKSPSAKCSLVPVGNISNE